MDRCKKNAINLPIIVKRTPSSDCLDFPTPLYNSLSAKYKKSYAFYTTKVRWPKILQDIMECFLKDTECLVASTGPEISRDVCGITQKIQKLITDINSNRSLNVLLSKKADANLWNKTIEAELQLQGTIKFYQTKWLLAECYIYRKLDEIVENSKNLKSYDLFFNKKKNSYFSSFKSITTLAEFTEKAISDRLDLCSPNQLQYTFTQLLHLNLWGNQCDLSLSLGAVQSHTPNPVELIEQKKCDLLIDDSDKIWTTIQKPKTSDNIVIFVCDNAGFELFSDLCLADFILSYNLCTNVHFYLKYLPWFISDALEHDFNWIVEQACTDYSPTLQKLGERWKGYLRCRKWVIYKHPFWTVPHPFNQMNKVNECLYTKLGKSKLIIFKGDLNYRKLLADINWPPTTTFHEALQTFHPGNLCTLRTLKCDLICGLQEGEAEELAERYPDWLLSGNFAVIQFDGDVNDSCG